MRKLYIVLDEWKSNKVFIEKELDLLLQMYDVTIITNDIVTEQIDALRFLTYKRPTGGHLIAQLMGGILSFLLDKTAWDELFHMKHSSLSFSKVSEIIRFYINAHFFYKFLCDKDLLLKEDNTIFYFYWNFWKCFAVTNHRNRYPSIKIISRIHGYDLYNEQIPSGYQPFKRAMDEKLDCLVFVADHGMEYYFRTFAIKPRDKHRLYYLGTENTYGMCCPSNDGILRVVSCSALVPIKRVELIIKGLSKVQDLSIQWVHFGDGILRYQLEELADECLHTKPNITFSFCGYILNKDLIEFYHHQSVDLFITTSASEGNPVSIFEAMSFGIPIMTSAINNLPYLAEGNGVVLSANPEPDEIGRALEQFACLSMENRDNLRRAARSKWEENYVASVNYSRFVKEVINQL